MLTRKEGPALMAMLNGLADANPAVAAASREAAQLLLLHTPPRELIQLEQDIRLRTRGFYYHPTAAAVWQQLDPEGLGRASSGPGGGFVVRFASFHKSGFVRQAAVQLLDAENTGAELAFLLLRVNDWVAPVQKLAQAAVERRINPPHAWLFLHSHFLVHHLANQRRNDLRGLYEKILTLLRSPASRDARETAFTDADRHVRRAAFVLSTEAAVDNAERRAVILRGLRSADLWVRVFSARTARTRLYGPALREALGQARGDRSIPVRREALLGFVDEHPELRGSLLDPSFSLREMVRFYLRKKANLDFAEVYRQELERIGSLASADPGPGLAARLAIALSGLGETGEKRDAERLEIYTIDARPRVRRSAIIALGRLDAEGHSATLGAAISDENPSVARAALHALGPRLPLLGEQALRRAHDAQADASCKAALASALALFRK